MQNRKRTAELIKMGFGSRADYKLSEEMLDDSRYVVKHTGQVGTVMIGNPSLCLHRAGVPDLGHTRDMIVLQIEPSDKPLMEDWLNHPDPSSKYD